MLKHWRGRAAASLMLGVLSLTPTEPAHAITVFDPTNYAQNILQATRALEQIHNQISQIDQAARMLAQNPLQLSPELASDIASARQLFSQAQGIAFDLNRVSQDFRSLYPDQWANMNLGDMLAQSDRWLSQDRQSVQSAMEAEARAAQAIGQSQSQIERALQSSSGAQGQTGAIQASNQLLGVTASELAQIHALLIAQGRALETERMERIAREERAAEIQRRAFPTQSTVSLDPARSAFNH
jgi:P-type conjugative transfer protein TrbJ